MRSPSAVFWIPASSLMFLMFTTRLGVCRCSFMQAEQVRAAGQHIGLAPPRAQQRDGFLNGCRIGIFEGLHYAFLPSSASST